ncbi:LPXTG-domain-containing protein cell wall anchor domain [Histomonas meleagridis]|uniref:LPXTG-domain-containing protein cell wall anchor domain n=1 Tax=Histomonas meleagridis TaxID=135588 RepID=UPI00355A0E04|nr:LPXTG-domain-containing protein cell wall anchor domain [Histomonas meleagridis]KAH0803164.1 LPXTG-domain-containing protein cell wall anchor domain [Histomonas meleagridis]
MILLFIPSIICDKKPKHAIFYYGQSKYIPPHLDNFMKHHESYCKGKTSDRKCDKGNSIIFKSKSIIFYKGANELSNLANDLSGIESAVIYVEDMDHPITFDLSKVTIPKLGIYNLGFTTLIKNADISKTIPVIALKNIVSVTSGTFVVDQIYAIGTQGNVKANRYIGEPDNKDVVTTKRQYIFTNPIEIIINEDHYEIANQYSNGVRKYSFKYKDDVGILLNPYEDRVIKVTLASNCKENSVINIFIEDPFTTLCYSYLEPDEFDVLMNDGYFASVDTPKIKFAFDNSKWVNSKLKINIITTSKTSTLLDINTLHKDVLGEFKEDRTFEGDSKFVPDDPDHKETESPEPDKPEKSDQKETESPEPDKPEKSDQKETESPESKQPEKTDQKETESPESKQPGKTDEPSHEENKEKSKNNIVIIAAAVGAAVVIVIALIIVVSKNLQKTPKNISDV